MARQDIGLTYRFIAKLSVLIALGLACAACNNEPSFKTSNYDLSIIPKPQELKKLDGSIRLTSSVQIEASAGLESAHKDLSTFLSRHGLFESDERVDDITQFTLELDSSSTFKREGYALNIGEAGAEIISDTEVGIHRGMATLKQLILINEESGSHSLPFIEVKDWAAFEHRGLLLDCSRHFFKVEVVKKYIDLLAFFKMNTLHWHLTEDQGWRIEIDKYPQLTRIGAYRKEADGRIYGGFYSKEEIREIVAYASERHIAVIPEIELPGHAQAALAAYPQFSCKGNAIQVANDWGVFKEIYCAGNDSTFAFLEDVFTEVIDLFPSERIHIGGDEAPKIRWEECPKCQQRISDEGLADESELQSYFIRRIQTFLHQHGKQIIGWDEILEGGLAEGAVVQSWRGMEGGIEAVRHGNSAIMSPTSHAYFDYGLDAIDLEKVYGFNPVPSGLSESEQKRIIGGECNIWTERVPDEKTLDNRVFPRLLAMAEVLWSDSSARHFPEFEKRIQSHYPILEKYGVKYGPEAVAMSHQMRADSNGVFLKLIPYSGDISLKYHQNCPNCDTIVRDYQGAIPILKSSVIGIQPYRHNRPYGDSIYIPVRPHKAINAEVNYATTFSDQYTAGGAKGLTDGLLGTLNFRDGAWQGFQGQDVECTLQLADAVEISSVTAHFYQYSNSWIFIPTEVAVMVSSDGETWKNWGKVTVDNDPMQRGQYIQPIKVESETTDKISFIRLTAKSIGEVPEWHEAAGSETWIFTDEIIVE